MFGNFLRANGSIEFAEIWQIEGGYPPLQHRFYERKVIGPINHS
jgi:hypothetical protein